MLSDRAPRIVAQVPHLVRLDTETYLFVELSNEALAKALGSLIETAEERPFARAERSSVVAQVKQDFTASLSNKNPPAQNCGRHSANFPVALRNGAAH